MSGTNKGFFEPCWIPVGWAKRELDRSYAGDMRRPYEEVYQKLERYEATLERIAHDGLSYSYMQEIAREALDDAS